MVRAAEARTSTRVSSISRMIMRIILAGSSALSSRSVTLAAMISRVREKMPMGKYSFVATKACPEPGRGGRARSDSLLARGAVMRISSPAFTEILTGRGSDIGRRLELGVADPAGRARSRGIGRGRDREGGKDESANQSGGDAG